MNHEILARLPITKYWTTDYDQPIEKALEAEVVARRFVTILFD